MTKPRTNQQNKALHLYFEMVAQALNDAGLSQQVVLSKYKVELDWSKERVKENLWRPIQKALTHKTSTTELKKHGDIDPIYEHVNRFLSQMGVHVPFPVDESNVEMNSNYHSKQDIKYPDYDGEPSI